MLNFGLSLGKPRGGVKPIFQGEFIYYSFDPVDGFITESDGRRYVHDIGNTIMVPPSDFPGDYGTKHGQLRGGSFVELTGDGAIGIPVDHNYDYIVYYDYSQATFVTTPTVDGEDTYTLIDGTYGSIGLTNEGDSAVYDADPELLIRQGLDGSAVVWPVFEGKGHLLFQADSPAIEVRPTTFSTYASSGETATHDEGDDWFEIDITANSDSDYKPIFIYKANNADIDVGDTIHFTLNVTDVNNESYWGKNYGIQIFGTTMPGTAGTEIVEGKVSWILRVDDNNFANDEVAFYINGLDYLASFRVEDIGLHVVKTSTKPPIEITGTYSWVVNKPFGAQASRFELNELRTPIRFEDKYHMVRFKGVGENIDTGVVIDGANTDMTMMLAFSIDESAGMQIIADSGGTFGTDPVLMAGYRMDSGKYFVRIGDTEFDVTPHLDPDAQTHALAMVFDHATGEVMGAADGAAYQSFGTVTFSGPTKFPMRLGTDQSGNSPITGYLGEGVLSATKESEESWQWFWNRVKDTTGPDWWEIDSLDEADILGAWDMVWPIHRNQDDAMGNLAGSMPDFRIDSGSPTWQGSEKGLHFGGAGSVISDLPDGIDARDLTVIIEIHDVRQKGTLDALYSHYIDSQRYCFQNGWNGNKLRWSAGDNTCTTIEEASVVTEGVIATSGRDLYLDGTLLGSVPDSGPTSTSNFGFRVGCVWVSSGRTQYSIFKLKRLLIVNRQLTEAEIQEITQRMQG